MNPYGTQIKKAWDLAVPEIFVPGLSQRYFSQSQPSQENQSQSQVPGQKSHGIPVTLPIPGKMGPNHPNFNDATLIIQNWLVSRLSKHLS